MTAPADRYDTRTIAAHWTVAALVAAQWIGGRTIDWFAKGPPKVDARSVHIILGVMLALALIYRIQWRVLGGRRFPPDRKSWDGLLSSLMHLALYAALITVVGLGLWNEGLRGDDMLGLFHLPKLGGYDKAARHLLSNRVTTWHGIAANIVVILAGLHAAAALVHHYILRDGILRRMLPG